ncbi:hypothetical protein DZF91_19420 [Actinomadura logoneensis]|uniref:Mce-associated membrane protein n=1 Tax=Actinomadura logoneensis TaxID=2293572 RepID=A0A372JJ79_9ACTN|nr:hypothetical protein [Actinomadura logoneensis]RFU39989.1 hypothetical protein DZF91_19420 [Actinomadura logoneensis]
MTAKTTSNAGKDEAADEAVESGPGEVAAGAGQEAGHEERETAHEETGQQETGREEREAAREAPAKPAAKRKRRVRVIEVIEDEDDLDEVLAAIESGELLADETGTGADAGSEAATERKTESGAAAKAKPKPVVVEEPDDDETVEADEAEKAADKPVKARRPERSSGDSDGDGGDDDGGSASRAGSSRGGFAMSRNAAIVTVVVVALLASFGIWQWTKASKLSGDERARDEVEKSAAAFGDAVLSYNSSNYQDRMEKVQKMLAGDLLDLYKRCTVPNLTDGFKANSSLSFSSKTTKVFVGDVNGKFATATVATDITLQSSQGSTSAPASLIRLSLVKSDGTWKVTQQFPSGVNQQSSDCSSSGQIPVAPNGQSGNGGKPSATPSAKPSN